MRGMAVVILTLTLCPGTVLGQGSQASGGRRPVPASLARVRMDDLSTARLGEMTFVFERPGSRDSNLSGLRIKVRPSGKSVLKIKTAVRF